MYRDHIQAERLTVSRSSTSRFGPLIWRGTQSDFCSDEPLQAATAYPQSVLYDIRSHGYDAIWLRGRLQDLMDSTVFAQLNDPKREQRIDNLRDLIERGRRAGVGLYLFFNEPLALSQDDPFWQEHRQLKGEPFTDPVDGQTDYYAWCTTLPIVKAYVQQAVESMLTALDGLAGVILITASEHHTHCWSHHIRTAYDDGYVRTATEPLTCERCRNREPADVVGELVSTWHNAAACLKPAPRVLVWNWSWSFWYGEPQAQVIDALPDGVELMVDWERGGCRPWQNRQIPVDEYSLGFVGPSERAVGAYRAAQKRGLAVNAKLQIGTTHEIATVANLPLIANLHAKCCSLYEAGVCGVMATWNFGCWLTLNSFACGQFWNDPCKYTNDALFFDDLTQQYLGLDNSEQLVTAWRGFGEAFTHFPFSTQMLYSGPVNRAPIWPLSLQYDDRPLGPSWLAVDDGGGRLEDCLGNFTLDETIDGFTRLTQVWDQYLPGYVAALQVDPSRDQPHHRRRVHEAATARMIGHQMHSTAHIFAFHRWRGVGQPKLIDQGLAIVEAELDNLKKALPLVEADPRMGYHIERQAYMYDGLRINNKLAMLERLLRED